VEYPKKTNLLQKSDPKFFIPDPGSKRPDPGSGLVKKILGILNIYPKSAVSPIPDHGSRIQRSKTHQIPDPRSQIPGFATLVKTGEKFFLSSKRKKIVPGLRCSQRYSSAVM
jgi:hypothetical protein